jgi:hypothetical protein
VKLGSLTCTHFGAAFRSKKTLISAQHLENKGPEIFLPPRSMVLKVVTGKIQKTLELSLGPAAWGSVSELRKWSFGRGFRLRRNWSDCSWAVPDCADGRVVKERPDDQIICKITSLYLYYRRREVGSKEKIGDSGSRFPFWEFWHRLCERPAASLKRKVRRSC